MTNAYCDLEDVKASLSGDALNMSASFDQSLANKILEVSRDIDRRVAECRGESDDLFSFLAEQTYGRQKIYLAASPAPTTGTFVLMYDGEVTGQINYDASASDVADALQALVTVDSGNVSVSGFAGGPWTVDFAGALDGPRPPISGRASVDVADAAIVVLPMIQGVSVTPSERRFHATPALYGEILPIHDCVELVEVRKYDAAGVATLLVENVDYVRSPSSGTPIEGLKSLKGSWEDWPTSYGVTSRWGYRLTIPGDVREAATIETIRSHFSALAGNDDRIGITPFGKVMTSKAFSSKFWSLTEDYGRKFW